MNKTCDICGGQGKYKCPTCLIFYCSVICCKKHRQNNCEVIVRDNNEKVPSKKRKHDSTETTIPEEKIKLLRNNDEVNKLLTNHHLRNLLVTVDEAQNAEQIMQKAMQEPIFVEFADTCLKVVESNNETEDNPKTD